MSLQLSNHECLTFARPEIRDADREEIARLTEVFLCSGGKIASCDTQPMKDLGDDARARAVARKRRAKARTRNLNYPLIEQWRKETDRIITIGEVTHITGLSIYSVRHWSANSHYGEGVMPVPGSNPRVWMLHDVISWCDEMVRIASEK